MPLLADRIPISPFQMMTSATFREFIALPENAERSFELWEGVIIEMPKPHFFHSYVVAKLIQVLLNYLDQYPLGIAIGDNTEYSPAEGVNLVPDASFISNAKLTNKINNPVEFMPELAIEVLSPSNTASEMDQKVRLYFRYGVQLVWEFYPESRSVRVYSLDENGQLQIESLSEGQLLTGGHLLPTFSVAVEALFPKFP